jgi:sugar lactone lactonase YvrE
LISAVLLRIIGVRFINNAKGENMNTRNTLLALSLFFSSTIALPAWADDGHHVPHGATFTTLAITSLNIEGMTGDNEGNLYTPARQAGIDKPCPVWRVNSNSSNPLPVIVGLIPAPAGGQCAPLGLAFDKAGKLFVTETDKIYSFVPNATTPPTAALFASGVPGTNGVAFDEDGNLWTSDGTTGQGRVWMIIPSGVVTEVFRIQPIANEVNLVAGVGGVGRDVRTLPPGKITVTPTTRNAADAVGSQPLVANGLAFDKDGDLFVSDTARGAIWKVKFDRHGNLRSRTNCDATFHAKTLCMENLFIAHPLLEGADGIALDRDGNIWVSVNERNAIVVVTDERKVIEVFRNAPDPATQLRNAGQNAGAGLLEFPTSPFLSDRMLCTASSDGNRRDNSPNTAGEIDNTTATSTKRGKISCMDQRLHSRGVTLPVR